ncbi:MAG: GntR family transcriptional regulator [Clostridia bacterium]|nr:GntR family transcriptional regulator [Oscillospiraceae bacterium]MBQ3523961.1 GntR family transcriptional regulator [Clostridia bacterium]
MVFSFTEDKPLYLQIAEQLEDAIFIGAYKEETQIPSTTELSVSLQMNPATVLKGMNILVAENIIYKKRGLGMFVCTGAVERIKQKRQEKFYDDFVLPLLDEAKKLGLNNNEIINLIEKRGDKE